LVIAAFYLTENSKRNLKNEFAGAFLSMKPKALYEKLLTFYGPQKWWPGEGFEIAIGAVLTQNTSWRNVELALENLRKNDLLSPEKILACDISTLKKMIAPAGFFNQKAHYLRNLCEYFLNNHEPTREGLLKVKGIGEETADSILLYLFNLPEFVVDAYTVRISNRLGFGESAKKRFWKRYYEDALENDPTLFNEFHALLVKHAKAFCHKRDPLCEECFLRDDCVYGKNIHRHSSSTRD